jgi:hypothetical protein
MLRLLRCLTLLAALAAAVPAAPAAAQRLEEDVVYLRDGRIIRGIVVEYRPDADSFLMRLHDGSYERINKADVVRIVEAKSVSRRQGPLPTKLKSPALAWALSAVVPGAGQVYNGEVGKGVTFAAVTAFAATLYFSKDAQECDIWANCAQVTFSAVLGIASWLGSQIEAPLTAMSINRQIRSGVSLQVGPVPDARGVSLVRMQF